MSSRLLTGVILLAVFAALATLAINSVERNTREDIAANQAAYAMRLVDEVLPGVVYDNEPHTDIIGLTAPELSPDGNELPAYRARLGGQTVAVVMTVESTGYVGPIRLLLGIDSDNNILRVRASEHRETPGLGDRIEPENSDWITVFNGLGLSDDLRLRRDGGPIDHMSGATITSRAVARSVAAALNYYVANKETINAPPVSGDPP
jgi:electron transport complex protein RnfG